MKLKVIVASSIILCALSASARAPVEELSVSDTALPAPVSASSQSQRLNVRRLEPVLSNAQAQRIKLQRQVSELVAMDLPTRLQGLEQKMAALRGAMQEQSHALKKLGDQQKKLYADLDHRFARLKSAPHSVKPVATQDQEKTLYNKARATLHKKEYSVAKKQLLQYLKRYPTGRFAAKAHYWLGEIALLQKK